MACWADSIVEPEEWECSPSGGRVALSYRQRPDSGPTIQPALWGNVGGLSAFVKSQPRNVLKYFLMAKVQGLRPHKTKYQVLEAIVDLFRLNRMPPTMDQVRERVGLTGRSGVHHHVGDLKGLGLVVSDPHRYKTMRPTKLGMAYVDEIRKVQEELF